MNPGNGNLPSYEHYWYVARGFGKEKARRRQRQIRANADFDGTWGSAGDPLGSLPPAAQDKLLGYLAEIAAGRIDDWESLIDPTLSYGPNKAKLLKNGGSKTQAQKRKEREAIVADGDDRARAHAKQAIRENFESIENGQKQGLIDDIAAEFGEQFVAGVLERERIDREPEPEPVVFNDREPEPADPEPIAVGSTGSEPADIAPVTEMSEPEPEPITAETARYTGLTGEIRLLFDVFTLPLRPIKEAF